MSSSNVIEAHALTKKFGDFTAVNGIDLEVKKGELFGLLGPNGAGKSTTMYMLSTILPPTSGTASVSGFDTVKQSVEVRKSIGMVFQDSSLDTHLSGYDNLDIHGRLYGMAKAEREAKIKEVLELVELVDWAGKLTKTYSGGMRRRLEIARGLMHTPAVLFLDEPTLGLDPQTRRHIWDYLLKLKSQGVSMVLTTHYLEEADSLCDRIAIVDHGVIKALGTPEELKRAIGENAVYLSTKEKKKLTDVLNANGFSATEAESLVMVKVKDGASEIPKILKLTEKEGIGIESVELRKPSLEDVFIQLTGRKIRDEAGTNVMGKMMAKAWGMRGKQ